MIKKDFQPDWLIHPGFSLKEFLEVFNISQKELSKRIGISEKHIVDILKGDSPITPETALKLENIFPKDIAPANFWNNLQANYNLEIERLKQKESLIKDKEILSRFSYSDLVKNKIIEKFDSWEDKILGLRNYFGVSELGNIRSVFGVAFRKTDNNKISSENLSAWLRYGELEAGKIKVNEFDKSKLKSKLNDLKKLTNENEKEFPKKIIEICADCGVKVVFSPYIEKTYVNGATRWIGDNPVLQLSTRGKYADMFWFTFFHELGHILLHGKKDEFLEFEKGYQNPEIFEKENEADNFATNTLILKTEFNKFFQKGDFLENSILEFSKQVGVHSGIIAGRLGYYDKTNFQKFEKFRQKLSI